MRSRDTSMHSVGTAFPCNWTTSAFCNWAAAARHKRYMCMSAVTARAPSIPTH